MDFFERQDKARRKTKLLVAYFTLAVIFTVIAVNAAVLAAIYLSGIYPASPSWWLSTPYWIYATAATLFVIGAGSGMRLFSLRGGGPSVAAMNGARRVAPDTRDPAERRLVNVAEEMAIASGVPVPEVWIMDSEPGINAFVAGYSPTDTVMVFSKGALDALDRGELQGVAGHEFSHIFNGDMRINVRLIGILAGILAIGQVGFFILRSLRFRGSSRRSRGEGRGALFVLAVGAALVVVGYIGLFFGRLIKAAISRQRELLADASSVQYTRSKDGIAGALLKIMHASSGSLLVGGHAEDMSHMCFGESVKASLGGLLATHPPIAERIEAIDPYYLTQAAAEKILPKPAPAATPARQEKPASTTPVPTAFPAAGFAASGMAGTVGNPTPKHMDYAAGLLAGLPGYLTDALHTRRGAAATVYAMLLPEEDEAAEGALEVLARLEDREMAQDAARLRETLGGLGPSVRLPLVDIAMPALRLMDAAGSAAFLAVAEKLVRFDGKLSLFEYCLQVLLRKNLTRRAEAGRAPRYASFSAVQKDAALLMSALADAGGARTGESPGDEYTIAMESLALGFVPRPLLGEDFLPVLDTALYRLEKLTPALKKQLVAACVKCVEHDGVVNPAEGELLRAVSASLDCPMPPLLSS